MNTASRITNPWQSHPSLDLSVLYHLVVTRFHAGEIPNQNTGLDRSSGILLPLVEKSLKMVPGSIVRCIPCHRIPLGFRVECKPFRQAANFGSINSGRRTAYCVAGKCQENQTYCFKLRCNSTISGILPIVRRTSKNSITTF